MRYIVFLTFHVTRNARLRILSSSLLPSLKFVLGHSKALVAATEQCLNLCLQAECDPVYKSVSYLYVVPCVEADITFQIKWGKKSKPNVHLPVFCYRLRLLQERKSRVYLTVYLISISLLCYLHVGIIALPHTHLIQSNIVVSSYIAVMYVSWVIKWIG